MKLCQALSPSPLRFHSLLFSVHLLLLCFSLSLSLSLSHAIGILWNAQQRNPIGKPHSRNPLESTTQGFHWKASQQESFGKHHKGILLESLKIGILWKAQQKDSIGKPHSRNLFVSPRKGIPISRLSNRIPSWSFPKDSLCDAFQKERFVAFSRGFLL